MVTQTRPAPTEHIAPVRESESDPIETNRTGFHVVDLPSRVGKQEQQTSTAKSRSLPARIVHRLRAFYGWLEGPPATAQERMRSSLVDAEHQIAPFSAIHRKGE